MWKQEGKKAKLNVEQLCEQRKPQCQGPLGYPEKKVNRLFNAWVSGAYITPPPANSRLVPCQLDLKGSCSEAKGRSCGFFPININALSYATGALKHNLFSL